MKKLKVLFIAESLSVGGAEKALVSILKAIDYSKFDVTLLLISKSGGFVSETDLIENLKVKYIVEPNSNPFIYVFNLLKVKAIYKWLHAKAVGNYLCKGYDVVVAFCEGYLTRWIGASTVPCRKIAWVHTDMVQNDWPVKTGVFRNQEEEVHAYANFDEVVAVSKVAAEGMKEKFGCATPTVIYNILDRDIIEKSKDVCPDLRCAKLNLVSVGRLEFVKGYDRLIDAMDILINNRHLDIHLVLVGDGSKRAELELLISKKGLTDNVTLVGMQSNPYPYVANADIFVCPSRQEGFNIAILEAMTLGKPVVATACAGPLEILDNGKYGLIVENDINGLVHGISQIYYNPMEINAMSGLSTERSKYFTAEKQLQSLYSIIGE